MSLASQRRLVSGKTGASTSVAPRTPLTPNTGKEKQMQDVQKMDAVASTDNGPTREWCDNEPRRFVLRGDAECRSLLDSLDGLGVKEFRCFMRARADDGADVFTTIPAFKKRTTLSVRRLREVKQLSWRLGNCVADAVLEALSGTSADGYDLLIESNVIVSDAGGPRAIPTWVTVISACDPEFDGREIQLL